MICRHKSTKLNNSKYCYVSLTIQLNISLHAVKWSNSSICLFDRTLSGANTPGNSGPSSNGNKGVLHIHQSSSIIGASASDCLMSYAGHSLDAGEGSYLSAEMLSVYSTALANWVYSYRVLRLLRSPHSWWGLGNHFICFVLFCLCGYVLEYKWYIHLLVYVLLLWKQSLVVQYQCWFDISFRIRIKTPSETLLPCSDIVGSFWCWVGWCLWGMFLENTLILGYSCSKVEVLCNWPRFLSSSMAWGLCYVFWLYWFGFLWWILVSFLWFTFYWIRFFCFHFFQLVKSVFSFSFFFCEKLYIVLEFLFCFFYWRFVL